MNSLFITLSLLTTALTNLQTTLQTQTAYAAVLPHPIREIWNRDDIIAYIKEESKKYNVDPIIPIVIVENESDFDAAARGDNGLARGLAQIRSDYHPNVTDAEADDPSFAIDFLVRNLAAGHTSWWSTYPLKTK